VRLSAVKVVLFRDSELMSPETDDEKRHSMWNVPQQRHPQQDIPCGGITCSGGMTDISRSCVPAISPASSSDESGIAVTPPPQSPESADSFYSLYVLVEAAEVMRKRELEGCPDEETIAGS